MESRAADARMRLREWGQELRSMILIPIPDQDRIARDRKALLAAVTAPGKEQRPTIRGRPSALRAFVRAGALGALALAAVGGVHAAFDSGPISSVMDEVLDGLGLQEGPQPAVPNVDTQTSLPDGGAAEPSADGSGESTFGVDDAPSGGADQAQDSVGDSPGHSGNPPGQSGDPPGQSGDSPGHSGDPPGQSGDPPGQSGDPPGQSGDPPGQSGNPPGQSGDPPGQSGDPPGQSGNPPGRGR